MFVLLPTGRVCGLLGRSESTMTIIIEYRIVMPLSLDEYYIGQLFTVIECSIASTGAGDGIEWLKNEPFSDKSFMNGAYTSGQYTHKVYHMDSKLPGYVRGLTPKNLRTADEYAWNAFPYCRVEIKPKMSTNKFNIFIETMHLADRGQTENALNLSPELLKNRKVVYLDIVNDKIAPKDYKEDEDPTTFRSKNGRGMLQQNWKQTCEPVMCCYKVVNVECTWKLMSGTAENFIIKQYPRMFVNFHRHLFCSMDRWIDLTIEDIRQLEEETKEMLDLQRREGPARGINAIE